MKMSEAKFEYVWASGGREVRLDFDNDFHCAIRLSTNDSLEDVADKLISIGREMKGKLKHERLNDT